MIETKGYSPKAEHVHFERLLDMARVLPPLPTAVVAPESYDALSGAVLGRDNTLIDPIFVGCAAKIAAAAAQLGVDISGIELIDIPDHGQAAARAVSLVQEGRAKAVMKGHLHTDDLLRAVLKRDGGLRTDRRLSHAFAMDVPGQDRLLFITDAAINIAPDVDCKLSIAQNAIDLAITLGVDHPKLAVLSAVEVANPAIPSSVEAAELAQLADAGKITGGVVQGPLAMDIAIDMGAAAVKGVTGPVAGRADILLVPTMEAGNILFKALTYLAGAKGAGIVLGASVPIILTSRSDDDKARLASCAVAALYAQNMA